MIEKHNYLNKGISYIKNAILREYDMTDAGFTIIRKKKLLKKSIINELEEMEKMDRHIYIGKIMREDRELSINLLQEFKNNRLQFMKQNSLETGDILYIKKDSICTINKKCNNLKTEASKFKLKNTYTTYANLNNKEFYYSSYDDELTIKGISKDIISCHEDYLLYDIKNFLKLSESLPNKDMRELLYHYRKGYIECDLDFHNYVEFNDKNRLKLRTLCSSLESYIDFDISACTREFVKNHVDISYNYINYIINLIKILY